MLYYIDMFKSQLFIIFFQLLHFLMHLRGEPIGLSVGGLVVINKSLALSVCSNHIYFDLRFLSPHLFSLLFLPFFFLITRVIKCNRFPRQKGGHGPRRSMHRLRKLGTRNTTLLACGRKFWQVSRHKRSSRIQRCRSFSERVGPRIIFFKASQVSSCSKRSRGVTTEPIACASAVILEVRTLQ